MIISQDGVKRELEGPFALCIGRDDLQELILALRAAHAGMVTCGHSYGWLHVNTKHPDTAPNNTPPLPWSKV